MKLTKYSKARFMSNLAYYNVPKEWAETMYGYLVEGYPPGSFFTALLSNDAMEMIARSHPGNTITELKTLVTWLNNRAPSYTFYGSPEKVKAWLALSPKKRRAALEEQNLIYSEKEEIGMVLREDPVPLYVYN